MIHAGLSGKICGPTAMLTQDFNALTVGETLRPRQAHDDPYYYIRGLENENNARSDAAL